jgi:hypothetical protein
MEECYVDAALGCNNPVRQLIEEAELTFAGRLVDCIISIGTGKRETVGLRAPDAFQKWLPTKVIDVLKSLATDSQLTAEDAQKRCRSLPNFYFRLNVEHGMQGITLEEWEKLGEVATHTKRYLADPDVSAKVDNAVNVLLGRSDAAPGVQVPELSM